MKKNILRIDKLTVFAAFTVCLLAISSCTQNEILEYSEKPAVYFSDYSDTNDSLLYTFSVTQKEIDTMHLEVKLLGAMLKSDLKFKVKVNNSSTAMPNSDYKPLEDFYVFPAQSAAMNLPIYIINSEKLQHETVTLNLSLIPTDELDLAYLDKVSARIIYTDQIIKPPYWDKFFFLYFGGYSKTKHRKAIEIMGHDFPLKESELLHWGGMSSFTYWMLKGRELAFYYATNTNDRDENGNIITTWPSF